MTESGPPPGHRQEPLWDAAEPPDGADREPRPPTPGAPQPPAWTRSMTSTAAVPGPAGFYYADVPNRVIAYIVDLIILAVIGVVLAIVLGGIFGGIVTEPGAIDGTAPQVNLGAFVVLSIVQLVVSLAYFGYSWTTLRATPGMRLLGLQIGDETDGHSISWNQAAIRWLILGIPSILSTFASYVSSGLGFLLSLVGLVWLIVLLWSIAQSPTKQGFHDRYAHTILVKSARRAP